ncbi:MAG: beta-ketoacyl-ACP synthase II [Tumebacillaceae bacterium]
MKQRVVVTGLGIVSPLGDDVNTFWDRLMSGQSGITEIESFDTERLAVRIAGAVKEFDREPFVSKKDLRKMDLYTQYAVVAAGRALADAKLNVREDTDPERVGTFIGSYFGGVKTWEEQMDIIFEKGPSRVSPYHVPMLITNTATGAVSILCGSKGPNSAAVTGCASGTNSIGSAFRLIQRGEADVMICGGAEAAITEPILAGFESLGMLAADNDLPERASRPFAADRKGMVIGEGAGILVLESLEHAEKRGAHIYAEIVGYGMTSDAHDMIQPEPTGEAAARCMVKTMQDAGLQPQDISLINAYGIGTVQSDKRETRAIHQVFGERAGQVPVHSSKSMLGHLLGASGAVDLVISALVLKHGIIPPTLNADAQDEEFPLNLPGEFRRTEVGAVLNNTFGIGGHNASLILKPFKI